MTKMPDASFFELCSAVGNRIPVWNQGPGGNISWKTEDDLWIKASGLRLGDVKSNKNLVRLDLKTLLPRLKSCQGDEQYASILLEEGKGNPYGNRASMETGFHAFMPSAFVCHFHSLPAILMAHEHKHNKSSMDTWLKQQSMLWGEVAFIGPEVPGLALSREVEAEKNSSIFVLQNHGVILGFDDVNRLQNWRDFEIKFCSDWKYDLLLPYLAAPLGKTPAIDFLPNVPFKFFMPDQVVFEEKIKNVMAGIDKSRDAVELWLATQILHSANMSLDELPRNVSAAIGGLSTEKFRKHAAGMK